LLAVVAATAFATAGLFGVTRLPSNNTAIGNTDTNAGTGPVPGKVKAGETGTFPSIEVITPQDVLNDIEKKYGVFIPQNPSPEYAAKDDNTGQLTLNIVPTVEEAQVIEKAISKVPAAGFLSPLIIPFENTSQGAIEGGAFLGQDWQWMLRSSDYQNLPKDKWLDTRSATELLIPNVSLDSPLPEKTQDTANLPPLEEISLETAKVKVNLEESVPWTNQREKLVQTVVHEFFHALQDKVSIANSPSIAEYWNRQSFSLYNENTWDVTNPLFVTFAKVTGWKLVSVVDYMKQYDPQGAKQEAIKFPNSTKEYMWDMDPKIWGDLANRHGGPTIYSRYGPIQESMAEYWMTYFLYPNLLTPSERQYFHNIEAGLRGNPEEFIQEIVKDPNILLRGVTLIEK
jgi:hypothetical protein